MPPGQQAALRRDVIRDLHSHGHGNTVRYGKVGCRLDRMTKAVTIIEDVADAGVELIGLDEALLDRKRALYVATQQRWVGCKPLIVLRQTVECRGGLDCMYLDDLADPGAHVPLLEGR